MASGLAFHKAVTWVIGAIAVTSFVSGCGKAVPSVVYENSPVSGTAHGGKYYQHIVLMIQENRTFDNLFATFPGADGTTVGRTHDGGTLRLRKIDLESNIFPNNGHRPFLEDVDGGKMDGFDRVWIGALPGTYVYAYVDPAQLQPYWSLAKRYVLADHMFQTEGSGSFTAHQNLIAGGTPISATRRLIDFPTGKPWGCDAPAGTVTSLITPAGRELQNQGPFPCFSYPTLRDLLDAKQLSWKYYVPPLDQGLSGAYWNAFDAIRAVRYGSEWHTNESIPEQNIFHDISDRTLPAMSWVIPDNENSDHPGTGSDTGPSWVAAVVNAIGRSPYWKSTAIIIVWDDWGGWYDHVPPPKMDYGGLGLRVPMIVVAPYAKCGYVSHAQYEFGSIVRFIEDNWGLSRLGTTDVRAASFANDFFDFKRPARAFVPIAAKYSKAYFERQKPSGKPVDDE